MAIDPVIKSQLDLKLAKGEITREEYDIKLKALSGGVDIPEELSEKGVNNENININPLEGQSRQQEEKQIIVAESIEEPLSNGIVIKKLSLPICMNPKVFWSVVIISFLAGPLAFLWECSSIGYSVPQLINECYKEPRLFFTNLCSYNFLGCSVIWGIYAIVSLGDWIFGGPEDSKSLGEYSNWVVRSIIILLSLLSIFLVFVLFIMRQYRKG